MHHFVVVTSTTDKVKCSFHQTQSSIQKFGKYLKFCLGLPVKYSCACWNFFLWGFCCISKTWTWRGKSFGRGETVFATWVKFLVSTSILFVVIFARAARKKCIIHQNEHIFPYNLFIQTTFSLILTKNMGICVFREGIHEFFRDSL